MNVTTALPNYGGPDVSVSKANIATGNITLALGLVGQTNLMKRRVAICKPSLCSVDIIIHNVRRGCAKS